MRLLGIAETRCRLKRVESGGDVLSELNLALEELRQQQRQLLDACEAMLSPAGHAMASDDDDASFDLRSAETIAKATRITLGYSAVQGAKRSAARRSRQADAQRWLSFVKQRWGEHTALLVHRPVSAALRWRASRRALLGSQPSTTFSRRYAVTWPADFAAVRRRHVLRRPGASFLRYGHAGAR